MTEKLSEAYLAPGISLAGKAVGPSGASTLWLMKSKPTPKASPTAATPLAPSRNGGGRSSTSVISGSTGTIGSTSKIRGEVQFRPQRREAR
jgi:hypothetical protein